MNHILLDLTETPVSLLQNWPQIIAEINSEFSGASTTDYRVGLLSLFKATMDLVERNIAPEQLGMFMETRQRHYRSFLVQEARVGQNVCTQTLDQVTQREVAAGRLDVNDELRRTAVVGISMPHLSRAELIAIDSKKGSDEDQSVHMTQDEAQCHDQAEENALARRETRSPAHPNLMKLKSNPRFSEG